MTAITLRNLSPDLESMIRQRAAAEGLSLDRTVVRMLEEAAERRSSKPMLHDDLDHLAGTWSDEEADAFDAGLMEQRRIEPGLWE